VRLPLAALAKEPSHLAMLEQWMKSYRPAELFDGKGRLIAELRDLAPRATSA